MDYIEYQFSAFAPVFAALELVGLGFLVFIIAETIWDFVTKRRTSVGQTAANYAIALVNHWLDRTIYGLVFIIGLFSLEPYAKLQLRDHIWWSWPLAIIAADFTYYWMHRVEHQVRALWAYHSVHHSSSEFNLTTGLRLAWIEGLIEWIFFVPMILLGFSAIQTIIALAIVVSYQTWIHTEKIGKLGWADRIFNTPSLHRVHHGTNLKYLDKNYGGILIIWDRLFGTYQTEEEPVIYGVAPQVSTTNPIMINLYEYWEIIKDVARAKSLSDALAFIFKQPGWRPKK